MENENKKKPRLIDMSGRLHLQIVPANRTEIEQNNICFDELNKSIENKIEDSNIKINGYASEILNRKLKRDVETVHYTKIFDNISKIKDIERIKDKSYFYKSYISSLEENNKKGLYQKIIIILVLFLFVVLCELSNKLGAHLSLIKIPGYFIGVIYAASPILITIILYTIIKQALPIKKKSRIVSILGLAVVTVGVVLFVLNFNNAYGFIITAYAIGVDETKKDEVIFYPIYRFQTSERTENSPLRDEESNVLGLEYSNNFMDSVVKTYEYVEDDQIKNLSYLGQNVIAQNSVNGEEYTLSQLINRKLLIPYLDNDKEILFYGQFNKNDNWDGVCVFNIYGYNEDVNDTVLENILEAEYDDGKLISYRKLIRSTTARGVDIWSIFDGRMIYEENRENYARGENWNYYRANEYLQDFDLCNAEVENIIYIDDFKDKLEKFSFVEGYYCGNISNGYYNDDTGEAYTVKYSENGIVRTVYVGKFKNGLPNDQSGNAWQIVFDNSNNINKYFYYKGSFKNNQRQGNVSADNYVTQDEINEIIKGITFNCELNWYNESDFQNDNMNM